MKKLSLFLLVFLAAGGACRGPTYVHNGIELQCSWPDGNNGPATCVGGGKTYKCIGTQTGCGIEACGSFTTGDE